MKPTLVIMAAGMGSRYGGIKQIDPMGPNGEIILDYSVKDAVKAGFGRVVFIIRKDIEKAFRVSIGNRFKGIIDVDYVFQELNDDPDFQESIENRVFVDWSQDPSINVFDEEVKQKIDEAINKLSDIYRSVFVLRDIEGLSIKETSEILGITEENVKIRLRRARQFLRNYLSDYFEERLRESNASS